MRNTNDPHRLNMHARQENIKHLSGSHDRKKFGCRLCRDGELACPGTSCAFWHLRLPNTRKP